MANAGGIINIASAIGRPYDSASATAQVRDIRRVVDEILTESETEGTTPRELAIDKALARVEAAR